MTKKNPLNPFDKSNSFQSKLEKRRLPDNFNKKQKHLDTGTNKRGANRGKAR